MQCRSVLEVTILERPGTAASYLLVLGTLLGTPYTRPVPGGQEEQREGGRAISDNRLDRASGPRDWRDQALPSLSLSLPLGKFSHWTWALYLSPRGGSTMVDKARQWLTRDWRRPPYHSTVGVMALGHDGDVGSSVHFGDAIPWKCCLRPPTQDKSHSRYYVSQISHRPKVIP